MCRTERARKSNRRHGECNHATGVTAASRARPMGRLVWCGGEPCHHPAPARCWIGSQNMTATWAQHFFFSNTWTVGPFPRTGAKRSEYCTRSQERTMRPVPDQLPTHQSGDKKARQIETSMRHKFLSPSLLQSHGLLRFPKV